MFCSSKLNVRTVRVRDDGPKDRVREKKGQTDRGVWERVRDGRKNFSLFNDN